jgi:hypothetical protein
MALPMGKKQHCPKLPKLDTKPNTILLYLEPAGMRRPTEASMMGKELPPAARPCKAEAKINTPGLDAGDPYMIQELVAYTKLLAKMTLPNPNLRSPKYTTKG